MRTENSMKSSVSRIVFVISLTGCVYGASLGEAIDVYITASGVDREQDTYLCEDFTPTVNEVRKFLNTAFIITGYELHKDYDIGPCFVRGTANFRGQSATWEMRIGGTGHIIVSDDFEYIIADQRQRVLPEDLTSMHLPLENCDLPSEWHVLNAPPENAPELLELISENQLNSHNVRGRNHYWLAIDKNSYAFCSQPSRANTACGSEVSIFRNSGQWYKEPLQLVSVCSHYR